MSISTIVDALNKGVGLVDDLAGIAKAAGYSDADNVGKIVTGLINVANNVLQRIEDGKIVAAATDAASIKSVIDRLSEQNDKLSEAIAKS